MKEFYIMCNGRHISAVLQGIMGTCASFRGRIKSDSGEEGTSLDLLLKYLTLPVVDEALVAILKDCYVRDYYPYDGSCCETAVEETRQGYISLLSVGDVDLDISLEDTGVYYVEVHFNRESTFLALEMLTAAHEADPSNTSIHAELSRYWAERQRVTEEANANAICL